ncbi:MAG: radical SAM protein [Myxococcaceae bacterium]|jgi:anaerobic ribonucleoside-triphosphate reductase activating protein|nr:radical SAM protein [Myxococcaceae bacterium]MCA3014518.1 radical SAM protein [Myxococcaceae bacterium]
MVGEVKLRVAQQVRDTAAEGPGLRYAVWVQGCSLRCPGCCNPEMFVHGRGGQALDVGALAAEVLATPGIEGLSVLGGEPFEQAVPVAALCRLVKAGGKTVMVYSGYTLAELQQQAAAGALGVQALLDVADLLLDGRYDATRPEGARRWVGSTNQVLHFFTDAYRPDDARFWSANTVELRLEGGQLTINGWPAPADVLRRLLRAPADASGPAAPPRAPSP